MRSDRLAWSCVVLVCAACEIEEVGIPRTDARVALHGVLSASAQTQVILLERTRNGSVGLVAPPFDLVDPIGSDEGIAETGAIMRLTTPSGETMVAVEDRVARGDGKGGGVYRLALPGAELERQGTYRLTVQTTKGEVLNAETSVPGGVPALSAVERIFDRARDTVIVEWPAAEGARSYFVRVETPFGPRSFFTDSTRVRLTGELRNVEVGALPRVFIPGFPQAVTVSAVDSNFYHWYRTHNDAISGTGLDNRVQGGLGFFGALVRVWFEEFRVVAPQPEPVAGFFQLVGPPSAPHLSLELYVESRAARGDQADALSGRYQKRPVLGVTGCLTCGLLGSTRGGRVDLAFLRDWYARDTVDRFSGEIRGDTIVGSYAVAGGVVRFVKVRE